jgi:hypothetical protein
MAGPFPGWLRRQYDDIKGNLKWWLLLGALSVIGSASSMLISGLPWWKELLVGLVFSTLCLWAGIATWVSRGMPRLQTEKIRGREQPENYIEFEEAWQKMDYVGLHDRGYQCALLFTPLQMEALQLAKDLETWAVNLDPEPIFTGSTEDAAPYLDFLIGGEHGVWTDKVNAGFDLKWARKVETLLLKFAEEGGWKDYLLDNLLDGRAKPKKRIDRIRARLVCLALRASGLELEPAEDE